MEHLEVQVVVGVNIRMPLEYMGFGGGVRLLGNGSN